MSRGTQDGRPGGRIAFVYGAITLYGPTFPEVRLTIDFVTPVEFGRTPTVDSYNPCSETAAAYLAELVWAVSLFARHYSGESISVPPATEMFQFAGLTSIRAYVFSPVVTGALPQPGFPIRTPPGSKLARQLPRSVSSALPRPSSALGAKASTPCTLCSLTSSSGNSPRR